ncbi:hypothetical protein Tco_0277159 [Tanacetum coccineum]
MVATTEPKTIQKAVQISGALTDEAVRNVSIKKLEKRGNVGEPSKDNNGRDDNMRTKTGDAFATTVTDIAQKDKNKAKRTKPSTGMERVQEIEAEDEFILSLKQI